MEKVKTDGINFVELLNCDSDEDDEDEDKVNQNAIEEGSVVWYLELHCASKSNQPPRQVKDSDLSKSASEFQYFQQFIRASLAVVTKAKKSNNVVWAANVAPVHTETATREELKPTTVHRRYLRKYLPNLKSRQEMKKAVMRSMEWKLPDAQLERGLSIMCSQLQKVVHFFYATLDNPEIKASNFLLQCQKRQRDPSLKPCQEDMEDDLESPSPPLAKKATLRPKFDVADQVDEEPSPLMSGQDGIDPKMAVEIDKFFQKRALKRYLHKVIKGQAQSSVHDFLIQNPNECVTISSPLLTMVNLQFLPDDRGLEKKLFKLVAQDVYDENSTALLRQIRKEIWVKETMRQNYCFFCLIPEGILFFLQDHLKMSPVEAKQFYHSIKSKQRAQ